MSMRSLLLVIAVSFLTAACGAHRTTTLPQDWSASAGDRVALVEGGERVFTGAGKTVSLHDGSTGEVVWGERHRRTLGQTLLSASTFGIGSAQVSPGDYDADEYATVLVHEDGTLLILDFTMRTDRIRGFDLTTGDELWETDAYSFTLTRYEAVSDALRSAGGILGRTAATGMDRQMDGETPFYLEDLILPVPGTGGFLLKTRDGLAMVDSRTGEQRWVAAEIDGLGVSALTTIDGTSDLVVANYVPRDGQSRQVARISTADGTVRWATDYASPSTIPSMSNSLDLRVEGDRVVLVGYGVEVFDSRTGEALWRSHDNAHRNPGLLVGYWGNSVAAPVIEGGSLYLVDNTHRDGFRCISGCVSLVRKYDLDTGAVAWESETYEDMPAIRAMEWVDGTLVAAVSSGTGIFTPSIVVGLDPATGQVRWTSPETERSLGDPGITTLIVDGTDVIALLAGVLFRLDARTGALVASADVAGAGADAPRRDIIDADDRIIVATRWGVAAFDKADLGLSYARTFRPQDQPGWDDRGFFSRMRATFTAEKNDHVVAQVLGGQRLLLGRRTGGFTVLDSQTGQVVGDVVAELGQADRRSGPLGRQGFQLSDDARHLYVFSDGEVARYRLDD